MVVPSKFFNYFSPLLADLLSILVLSKMLVVMGLEEVLAWVVDWV